MHERQKMGGGPLGAGMYGGQEEMPDSDGEEYGQDIDEDDDVSQDPTQQQQTNNMDDLLKMQQDEDEAAIIAKAMAEIAKHR